MWVLIIVRQEDENGKLEIKSKNSRPEMLLILFCLASL